MRRLPCNYFCDIVILYGSREEISVTMFLPILLASCFVTTLGIEFLDTETLIVRQRPNGDSALFGYSAVLHSLDPSGGMDNMRYDA